MMTGLNITITIYRRQQQSDDDVGGSQQTRTPVRTQIPARISTMRSPQMLRAQGIESVNIFDCICQSYDLTDLDIRMDDIIVPETGQYTGMDFVVKSVVDDTLSDNLNDLRRHKKLSLQRTEIARRIQ